MKRIYSLLTVVFLLMLTMGCQAEPGEPVLTETPRVTVTPADISPPNERIMILEPASGSRVVSPVRVSGVSDSTFEQTLVVRLLLEDGSEIAFQPTQIRSELGQRGPFDLELDFDITGERQAFIQVFDQSARDGEIIHLASVGITLSETGPQEIRQAEPGPEQILILEPSVRAKVEGGMAIIRGYGWASFEQTLLVEVQDVDGRIVGRSAVTVQAPDIGQPGYFTAEVAYQVSSEGPGRILVRDISPAFGGDVHRSSVEIDLAP